VGEPDARDVPWSTIERLALEGGLFPPRYQPQSEDELADLLRRAVDRLPDDAGADRELLQFWLERYTHGGGVQVWSGCSCKEHPPTLRLRSRVSVGWQEYGDPLPGEAGLSWGPGTSAALDLGADLEAGHWWLGATGRVAGRVLSGGTTPAPDDLLAWPDWHVATGRADVRRARLDGGGWRLDMPRAAAGVRLGNWALTAGWAPRRVGPGLSGGLTLDRGGSTFPAVTARRTRPFRWTGFMKWLAPDDLLMRVGYLSSQDIRYHNESGLTIKHDHPWFFEWLIGWEPVSWLRVAATHTAMAAAEEGTLWPDLMAINFPIIGTTWLEQEVGPATDRLFAVQFEGRWRDAPWPLLPSRAGRVWWEYGGTDFLPSGPAGVVPQISAPASVVGIALYDPAWDLSGEYAELRHDKVLWYSNSSFPEGYSHERWLMGHALGGSGESITGTLRVRPSGLKVEFGLEVAHKSWDMPPRTPGSGERRQVTLVLRRLPGGDGKQPRLGTLNLSWFREDVRGRRGDEARGEGWRVWATVGMP